MTETERSHGGGTAGSDHDDATAAAADETVFALLSDETRVDIVAALAATGTTDGEADGDDDATGLRFSTLRHRVGVADSGRFNYHLGRLRGTLVERVEERYVLTPTGRRVARTLVAPAAGEASSAANEASSEAVALGDGDVGAPEGVDAPN